MPQHPTSSPAPRPTPASMPRAGSVRTPVQPQLSSTPNPAPIPVSDPITSRPAEHGRIADDGTVYLTSTLDGNSREIGSWHAGSTDEGLAHFGAKFDELATQVELYETRLKAYPQEADNIERSVHKLKDSLPTANVIGDIPALDKRLSDILHRCEQTSKQHQADAEQQRSQARQRKEQLAQQAEDIAENSTEWKAAGDQLREILQEWKTIKGLDQATDDQLWKRYAGARDAFNRRRGAHFADLDRQRAEAKSKKEDLVARAEALQDSTDWLRTAGDYRSLMNEWKAAGRAPREADDKLWERFRAAQDRFFGARNAQQRQRDEEFAANAEAKDALLAEYDPLIDPAASLSQARTKLRELQEKWDEIGFVPRNQIREYEDKIADLETRVSQAEADEWKRTDPETQARLAQFQAKADELSAQADAAEAAGKKNKAAQLREQAQQWQEWTQTAQQSAGDSD